MHTLISALPTYN